jgi:hypothetical protein
MRKPGNQEKWNGGRKRMLRLTSCGFNLIKSVGDREWGVGKIME